MQRVECLQVHGVLESWAPIFLLIDSILIGLGERGVVVELRNGRSKTTRDVKS